MPTPVEIYVNADRSLSSEWLPTESLLAPFSGVGLSPRLWPRLLHAVPILTHPLHTGNLSPSDFW